LVVAAEVPGSPASSGLFFDILRPDGDRLTYFYSSSDGWGQSSPIVLPASGKYYVAVSYNNQYFGEYRLRVTLVRPPVQLESENNDSVGSANILTYALGGGHQSASVAGYIGYGDSGDFFGLGNLSAGTAITLSNRQPSTSGLLGIMGIYTSAGALVTNSAPRATNFVYTIPSGSDGAYFARMTAGDPGDTGHGGGSGYTLRFDGGDYVDVGNPQALRITGNQTIEFWIKPANFANRQNPYAKAYAGEGTITLEPDGSLNYYYG